MTRSSATTPGGATTTARGRTPSSDVEQALVDAAEAVLVRSGPEAITVRAVATEAGVAPMGVYSRFGGKPGLVVALLARGFSGLRKAVEDRGETDPLDRLRASGVRYREFALANPQHYALMFGGGGATEHHKALAAVHAEAFADQAQGAFETLVRHVELAMAADAIPSGEAIDVAQQIWSTVHGAVSLELAGLVWTADPERTYVSLLDLLVGGLTRR